MAAAQFRGQVQVSPLFCWQQKRWVFFLFVCFVFWINGHRSNGRTRSPGRQWDIKTLVQLMRSLWSLFEPCLPEGSVVATVAMLVKLIQSYIANPVSNVFVNYLDSICCCFLFIIWTIVKQNLRVLFCVNKQLLDDQFSLPSRKVGN